MAVSACGEVGSAASFARLGGFSRVFKSLFVARGSLLNQPTRNTASHCRPHLGGRRAGNFHSNGGRHRVPTPGERVAPRPKAGEHPGAGEPVDGGGGDQNQRLRPVADNTDQQGHGDDGGYARLLRPGDHQPLPQRQRIRPRGRHVEPRRHPLHHGQRGRPVRPGLGQR